MPSLHKPGCEENLPINSAQQENIVCIIYTRHPAIENCSIYVMVPRGVWGCAEERTDFCRSALRSVLSRSRRTDYRV